MNTEETIRKGHHWSSTQLMMVSNASVYFNAILIFYIVHNSNFSHKPNIGIRINIVWWLNNATCHDK